MKSGVYLFLLLFLILSCTKGFKGMNTDKTGITEDDMKIDNNNIGIPLSIIQQGIYFNYDFGKGKNWPYQLMQNLSADMYSGYMHDYKPLNGGSHNSDYNLQDGWNSTMWENIYAYIFPQIKKSEDSTRQSHPQLHAITKILKVMILQRVTDYYGPIIYNHFGNERTMYGPESQQEVYFAFFDDLDTAVNLLGDYLTLSPHPGEFKKFDLLLDGNYRSWIKLANSLRLRIAIRIAMAAPEKAAAEAKKALENPYGVFESPKEIAAASPNEVYINPLGEINQNWGEAYMNANMESILNGYNDPRREVFFQPCFEDIINETDTLYLRGKYKGIRQGTLFGHTFYVSHSRLTVTQTTPAPLLTAAEVWFLRAEAALRNWTEENPGECYLKGISTSFSQWNVEAELYTQSEQVAADYTDAFDPGNNIKARCLVSPKWDDTANAETKLEKIITQKWLALFPEGCEAWAEQRRTGYPRLFPVRYNNSPANCIDTEIMIRRLCFPGKLKDTNAKLYSLLQQLLNGPDHAGCRLWWDTGRNF